MRMRRIEFRPWVILSLIAVAVFGVGWVLLMFLLPIAQEMQAKSRISVADAEFYANKKLSESLDEKVLRYKFIEKWNGELQK